MSNYKVEQVRESVMCLLGKNIFNSVDNNTLMWCDVFGGQVFSMDLNNHNKMYMFKILGENSTSFCVPIEGKKNQYIVGAGKRLLLVTWDGIHTMGQITKVLCEIPMSGVRINQCKVDKMGRLFFGTMLVGHEHDKVFDMQKRVGAIYRFSLKEGLVMMNDNIGFSNGIAWNTAWTKMYFVDSYELCIYEFDFDIKSGNINHQKVFMDLSSYGQVKKICAAPLLIDQDDHLYCSILGVSKILKINTKTHKVEQEIMMNVPLTSDMTFGGKNLDTMYVVTAAVDTLIPQVYPSGLMMKVSNIGSKGLPMHKFVMN